MKRPGLLEIFLLEIVIYAVLWTINDYIATFISVTFLGIFVFILIIALLVELIERSKVPRNYYYFMLISILAPILTAMVMLSLKGELDWLQF